MYTMVLMMAMAGSDDVASFGGRKNKDNGCHGGAVVATSCTGYAPASGCSGYAPAYSGCTGTVAAYSGCSGNTSCNGSKSGGFLGLRSGGGGGFLGLRNKDKGNGCSGTTSCHGYTTGCTGHAAYSTGCTGYHPGYSTGCTGGMIVGYPTTTAPVAMPAVGTTGEKPAETKKPVDPKKTSDN